MSVTKTGKIYTRSGPPEFWVAYNPKDKCIKGMGHGGKVSSKFIIVEPDPIFAAAGHNELSAFFLTIFYEGIRIDGPAGEFDANEILRRHNKVNEYDGINVLDFMVSTGAKIYPEITTHMLPGADPRPNVWDVPDNDNEFMINVIKHLGIRGMIKSIYVNNGFTFDELFGLVDFFFNAGTKPRRNYVFKLDEAARAALMPPFSQKEVKKLIG